jgi:hypothetical protein
VNIGLGLPHARKGGGWWQEREQHQEVIEQSFHRLGADVLAKEGAARRSLRYCVALGGSFGRHRGMPHWHLQLLLPAGLSHLG